MATKNIDRIVKDMWRHMNYRCKNDPAYANIEVRCTKPDFMMWAKREVKNFLFLYPDAHPSVDRPDPDRHYEFGNMRIMDLLLNRASSRFVSRYIRIKNAPLARRLRVLNVLFNTLCKELNVAHEDFIESCSFFCDTAGVY